MTVSDSSRATARAATRTVEGRIRVDSGPPAAGLALRLYSHGFADATTLLAEVRTDSQGFYTFTYEAAVGAAVNIEVRALDDARDREVSLSQTKFDAAQREVLDLVAPAALQATAPEYTRLLTDLTEHLGDPARLAGVREEEDQQDLRYLHRATGWDARVLALAARTEQLHADERTALPRELLYALLRIGLPSDREQLALVSPGTVRDAVAKAVAEGVVSRETARTVGAFQEFAERARRDLRTPGTPSTYGELLRTAGVSEADQDAFFRAWTQHTGGADELWDAARRAGVTDRGVQRLQLQGRLAHLTRNNAPLVESVMGVIDQTADMPRLVDAGYYKPGVWFDRLNELAGGDKNRLAALVPDAFAADSLVDRLTAYTGDLAARIRSEFPSHVVRAMVRADEIRLGRPHGELKLPVLDFLDRALPLGYRFGETPFDTFVADHRQDLGRPTSAALEGVKTLHRLDQVSHDGLPALAEAGYGSAQDVAATDRAVFVTRHAERLGGPVVAEQVHRRAEQITAVTAEVVTALRTMDSAPSLTALSGTAEDKEAAKSRISRRYPALEQLFGSFDFCACDHCRSVLGPAAYLVDLLQLINPGDADWQRHTAAWSQAHQGRAYPYTKPFDALTARRPDIQHTPLTCENTNTVHAQTDLFNEVAEAFIARQSRRRRDEPPPDSGEAVTEDLLAEPQNVMPAVYDELAATTYPLTLPFDLWTETVRRFLGHFDLSLADVADAQRTNPALFAAAGESYGRAAVLAERIGLSPAAYAALRTPDADWFTLYGYGSAADADVLVSAKTLARRLGCTYRELIELLRTRFVNPALYRANGPDGARGRIAVALHRIGISLTDVFRYHGHAGYVAFDQREKAEFEQRLADATARHAAARPAFDAAAWLAAAWAAGDFHGVLVLADPHPGCSFERTEVRHADRTQAAAAELHRLNLLLRLHRRLGIPLRDLDLVLSDFTPSGAADTAQGLRTALVCLGHLTELHELLGGRPRDRVRLLACWSPLGTGGERSPYEEAFVNSSVRAVDVTFDHPAGRWLQAPGATVGEHLPGLRAALGLSTSDIEQILAASGRSSATAPLSLAVVTELHHHRVLAELLGLSVPDLITLGRVTGLSPFAGLSAAPLADDAVDPIEASTLRFVRWAREAAASGFTPDELDHLLRHRADPVGPYRPDPGALLTLLLTLSTGIARIRSEHPAPPAPAAETRALVEGFVLDSLAAALPGDVTDALASDARLLTLDGKPLLESFTAAADQGVTQVSFVSADATGPAVGERTVAEPGTFGIDEAAYKSARFTGRLEVPADGAYVFSVSPQRPGAAAVLRMPQLSDDLLPGAGTVELRAGVPYAFTFEAHHLEAGHTRLLIEGAGLPARPLTGLRLYPAASVDRVDRARTLLTKAVRIATGLALTVRETRHALTHREDFAGLDLGRLPTRLGDPAAAPPGDLFPAFLALTRYAALRTEWGADPDDLVTALERTRRSVPQGADRAAFRASVVDDVCGRLGALLRRPPDAPRAAADHLGLLTDTSQDATAVTLTGLAGPEGLRRLWTSLRMAEQLGAAPAAVADWARVLEGDPIRAQETARALRDTVRGRFNAAGWRAVARPISDELRTLKRDALVAHLTHTEGFASDEEIYEHFLMDPGVQPVVRSSRIHAATAAVQLFVQRCLMDLEDTVEPTAVNGRWWKWMSRYRVWEVARKIFLHSPRYLAPELRDDKTHLFEQAESLLTQADVDNDLVEQVFTGYLQGLEKIAKLDIVSLCREVLPGVPPAEVLHIVGRTTSAPHEYFHRTYSPASRDWGPWRPIDTQIDGDHVVAAMWRGRLHLFWVTFLPSAEPSAQGRGDSFETLAKNTAGGVAQNRVQAQLSWTERVKGRWAPRRTGAFGGAEKVTVPFDAATTSRVRVYVTHDTAEGRDAIKVNLGAPLRKAFRLTNKYAPGLWEDADAPLTSVYTVSPDGIPTALTGSGALTRTNNLILTRGQREYATEPFSAQVLGTGGAFSLVHSDIPPQYEPYDLFQGHAVAPFFYSDAAHSFLVEAEPEYVVYRMWVLPPVQLPDRVWPKILTELPVKVYVPAPREFPDIGPRPPISPYARHQLADRRDWLINPGTVLQLGDRLVGHDGGLDLKILSGRTGTLTGRSGIEISVGSQVAPGSSIEIGDPRLIADQQFAAPDRGLLVIGGAGLNAPALAHLNKSEGGRRP
ncbi:neuraminidase-like domain-containing protein [Streptomyces sp. NBC_01381]|uniref:neuraminidase-like domain-containing protein n=1 Tax=Streptomyces sp. NBC_01381 TaxID=2903845 RepID=UPI00225A00FA|nr:neuraminidase-like domain-containing protein [Streptomyces sp. NBC_01381]MCX4672357.1 neuraminidase-like domain-containing protein [Streptomyces sp. NBC_01381]